MNDDGPQRGDGPLWRCIECDKPISPAPGSIERGWRTICAKCDAETRKK